VPPDPGVPPEALSSVVRILRDGAKCVCVCADGREIPLSHLVASNVQAGDEILAHGALAEPTADAEV
jgi:hypothetical protein